MWDSKHNHMATRDVQGPVFCGPARPVFFRRRAGPARRRKAFPARPGPSDLVEGPAEPGPSKIIIKSRISIFLNKIIKTQIINR